MLNRVFTTFLRQGAKASGLWLVLVLALSAAAEIQAATVAVVLPDYSAPYVEAADAIETSLGSEHTLIRVLGSKLAASDSDLSKARLLLAVGVEAAEQVAEYGGKTPVLALLVTDAWYREQGRSLLSKGGRSAAALVLEQPISRQFQLISNAFPEARKIGVLVGQANARQLDDLEKAANAQQMTLIGATVENESRLVATLGQVLAEADLLLAVPDPEVINRNTVQSVLMTTYRHRDPVIGYSKSLTRAGALLSLHSSPRQIGRQAGEIAAAVLNNGRLNGLYRPKYFSISVNSNVARSLSITIPTVEALTRALGGEYE